MSEKTNQIFCYIGKLPCGCTVAVTVDGKRHKKFVAEDVADFIRSGYAVSRVPLEEARDSFGKKCAKCKKRPA